MKRKELFLLILCGVAGGFLNGLFGSGAGIICVLMLRGVLDDERKAHATSTLVVLMMSAVSLVFYALEGGSELWGSARFIPGGIAGAVAGAMWLKGIKTDLLRRIFGGIIAVSGAVMLLS